jgi:hypothetical protein
MSDLDRIQAVWANQPKEGFSMSVEEIRTRSNSLQSIVRRRNTREFVVGACLIVVFGAFAVFATTTLARLGMLLTVAGVAYVLWRLHVVARVASDGEVAATQNWAQFYRSELLRQRDALSGVWRWYLGPLVPGMVVHWLSVGMKATDGNPVWPWVIAVGGLALCALVFLSIASANKKAAAALQAEIETLDRIS